MKVLQYVFTICLVFLAGSQILAQQGNVAAGGDASGAGGSMNYSIGQTDYLLFVSSTGSLQFGLQQPFFFEESVVPAICNLTTTDLNQGEDQCFDATETITLAGGGNTFIVEDGTGVELVAGNNILMLPGTYVHQGGYLHARIAENDDDFCSLTKSMLAVTETLQKPDQHPDNAMKNDAADVVLPETDKNGEPFLTIYPNPTTGIFTIEWQHNEKLTDICIEIFNMQGRVISTNIALEGIVCIIDLSAQPPGIYFVRAVMGSKVVSRKVIRQ
jgi:hypothetical protein